MSPKQVSLDGSPQFAYLCCFDRKKQMRHIGHEVKQSRLGNFYRTDTSHC